MVMHWAFRGAPVSPGDAALCIAFAAVVGLAMFLCVAGLLSSPRYLVAAVATTLLANALQHARVGHADSVIWNSRVARLRHDVGRHCPVYRKQRVQAIVARWAQSPKATTIACVSATGDVGAYANGYNPAILSFGDPRPCSGFRYSNYHGRRLTDGALMFFYCPTPPGKVA